MCDCGCGGCSPTKPVLINENLAPKEILSEGLKYHMDNARPLTEHVYRAGSRKYFELWAEARALYARNILEVQGDDLEVLLETDLGHFGMFEGKKVPLDFPIELTEDEAQEDANLILQKILQQMQDADIDNIKNTSKLIKALEKLDTSMDFIASALTGKSTLDISVDQDTYGKLANASEGLTEAEKKLNKPMRDSSGGKAYKVYVKDPKTKKIKTIRFGSGGLRAKINDKEARNAFAARHKCSTKKDKTNAGYWSFRLPRYAKLLGLKSNFGGFW